MLKTISRSVISVVFPHSCELCGTVLTRRDEGGICPPCENTLSLIAAPFSEGEKRPLDRIFAACYYEDKIKDLLRAFKFRRQRMLEATFLRLLEKRLEGQDKSRWDAVAPVPMPASKEMERGFNQSALLARGLARRLQKNFLKNALAVARQPQQQSKLNKMDRRENVKGLFRASKQVSEKSILLVDDIFTTGETAAECARTLKEAGAETVDVLVVARGRA